MPRAEGPLKSGTYIAIASLNGKDHLPKVEARENGHGLIYENDREAEDIQVCIISNPPAFFHFCPPVVF